MSFDTDRLHAILNTHATLVREYYEGETRYPFRIEMNAGLGPDRMQYHAFAIAVSSISNHRKLVREVFLKQVVANGYLMETWLRDTYPALDADCLSFELEVFEPAVRGEKFRLKINGASKSTAAVQLPTLTQNLRELHDRLAPMGKPSIRFLVNELNVSANSPVEALRIQLALHRPDLFDAKDPDHNHRFVVSQIHEVSANDAIAYPGTKEASV